jgi:hypothetical protein
MLYPEPDKPGRGKKGKSVEAVGFSQQQLRDARRDKMTAPAAKIVFEVIEPDCGGYFAQSLPPHRISVEILNLEDLPGAVERVLQRYLGRDPLPADFELRPINCEPLARMIEVNPLLVQLDAAAFERSQLAAGDLQKSYQSGLSQSLPGPRPKGAKAEYPFVRPSMTRPPPVNV